jgi:hypothetical protein
MANWLTYPATSTQFLFLKGLPHTARPFNLTSHFHITPTPTLASLPLSFDHAYNAI